MKRFKGFTLSELMVAITVLGVLCATVLPAVMNNNPNQNKMMMKKAYYTFSEVISEVINDTRYYPDVDGVCPDNDNGGYLGFDCTADSTGSTKKLPFLFAKEVNIDGRKITKLTDIKADDEKSSLADCNGVHNSCYVLTTNDGMVWAFPKKSLTKGSATDTILIGVDVNGPDRPNCYQGSTEDACKERKKNFDRFRIALYADGKIEVNEDDEWAAEAIQVSSGLSED